MQENIEDTVIISDTSCLIALTNANRLDILKKRYKNIKVHWVLLTVQEKII
jgi:predicted nucleic acid-binding protein